MIGAYSINEYFNKEYNNIIYDRIIVFEMLRSTIYLMIKDNDIKISQDIYCTEFYNETITELEKEAVIREKSQINWWLFEHNDELIQNIPMDTIIKQYTKKYDDTIKNLNRLHILNIEYIRKNVTEEYRIKRENYIKYGKEIEELTGYTRNSYIQQAENMYPPGENSIRFYINGGRKIDVHLSNHHVLQIDGGTLEDNLTNEIEYFCNKNFELLIKSIPIKTILENNNNSDYINNNDSGFTKRKK